ncbi:MAG TPA: PmoA family protein [Streptosporangiaceae bacterium]
MSAEFGSDGAVTGTWRGTTLFEYVYQPTDPALESPRPYFHPVRTLGGDIVSLYRPHDHVWHKGIAWSLCEVGGMNFWGGPSFRRDHGYLQLDNNGQMRHDGFKAIDVRDGALAIDERLTWVTPQGESWIEERRQVTTAVDPQLSAWRLGFATQMHNISGRDLPIGSATTQGRPDAGYSGLFWRGPRSFSGGTVLTEAGPAGEEELMGSRAPWLGYVGRHDEHGRSSTLVFADHPDNFCYPSPWFVRTSVYGCVCPAPFFSTEYLLVAGDTLTLRFDVIVADGTLDAAGCRQVLDKLAHADSGQLAVSVGAGPAVTGPIPASAAPAASVAEAGQ